MVGFYEIEWGIAPLEGFDSPLRLEFLGLLEHGVPKRAIFCKHRQLDPVVLGLLLLGVLHEADDCSVVICLSFARSG